MANDLTRFDFHAMRFVNSESVEAMTAEEVGQYILLICKAWLTQKDTTLPDDSIYLANVARVKEVSKRVLAKFPVVETQWGPRRRNDTLYGEWLLANERSESGRTAAQKRWGSNAEKMPTHYNGNGHLSTPALPIPNQAVPNQTNQTKPEFGAGNFKNIKTRYYSHFAKDLSSSTKNREDYFAACKEFGEDTFLELFEEWAAKPDNQWITSHPQGHNRLYRFIELLPGMIERRKLEKGETSAPEDAAYIQEQIDQQERERDEFRRKMEEDNKLIEACRESPF